MFKKPCRNKIRVLLLVGTVVQDSGDFRFRGRTKGRKGRRCSGMRTECGDAVDDVEELSDRKRSLDILSVKKVARLSASELAEV